MSLSGVFQMALYLGVLLALVKPLGWFMARVYTSKPCGLDAVLGPVERFFYRFAGVQSEVEMDWKRYGAAVILFSAVGLFAAFLLQRFQSVLPFNPQQLAGIGADSSFNTAV